MYRLCFKRSVKKDLKKIGKKSSQKILAEIKKRLLQDPRVGVPLKGKEGTIWRWRMGDYRVIYTFNNRELLVLVIRIAHRKEAYRNL